MKTSKRLLSLLLALTMVLSLMGNLSVAAFAEEVTPTVVTADGNDQPATPAAPTEGQTTPAGEDKSGETPAKDDETPAPANGDANAEPVPAEGEVTTPAVAVPKLKDGVSPTASATAQTGTAYLLSDLQAGKIFDGENLTYENYYYERSTDNGQTWSTKQKFEKALFGGTLIQLTETVAGTYLYRFYASFDGENFSTDTWTLTLTVEDNPTLEFSFHVGKDYNGNYPIIKLYNVTKDADGSEVLGDEIENVFLYGNFTNTPAEGEEEYDVAMGKLVDNYQTFYAKLAAGRYAYRAFAKDADGNYTIKLGGMTLNLPTDKNVDGGAGGGSDVYLQCYSYYISSQKTDKTYFTADEYHVRVSCPIMECDTTMGDPYTYTRYGTDYDAYPTVLYAAGNACLYNLYAYPDIEGYIFTQTINQTYRASYSAGSKNLTINTGITLDVTVPSDATFGLYFQWNNFNTTEVAPVCADESIPYANRWTDNKDGTKTAQYFISKSNSNYTWRLSDDTHVTKGGWLSSLSESAELKLSFADGAATDRASHDFSKLGTQVTNRDEADLQVNLDPSGYSALTGTTRVRAYRHWEIIDSDTGNIMLEPDFHWNVLSGDATYAAVNGGNTTANWADITPGTQDSIISVYYDSIDTAKLAADGSAAVGSHGGLFPATNPERVGVMVVGGTGVTHGTADADVDFNMEHGKTTTRSMDWDYNFDTWFYETNETNPTLDFTVNATGSVTVEYALAATDNSMNTTVSGFQSVSPDADGNYAVPLAAFSTTGNGKGGTVIIKMTDSTGVSYRLVRVSKVTITVKNASNPGEDIMPGDSVTLTFDGMYRGMNKMSGIFNPTNFQPSYYAGDTKINTTLNQYMAMRKASFSAKIPADLTFEEGASTTTYTLTEGYTFGSMYSAANPFSTIYGMTDTGVGTNFNAVMVSYYIGHYADAAITVARKVNYDVKLDVTDDNGKTIDDAVITLRDKDGSVIAPNEDGTYTLGYGTYTYSAAKNGYVCYNGTFKLGSADAADLVDGKLVKDTILTKAAEGAWDGTTKTEPKTDANGVYQISTGAELAWFAQTVNGGKGGISAVLTKDIDLAGYNWTPIGTNKSNSAHFTGSFDGQGHTVDNLYINYKANTSAASPYQGFFGYVYGKSTTNHAVIKNLTVRGDVILGGTKSVSTAYCGGVIGQAYDADLTNIHAEVNVSLRQSSGNWQIIGGVVGNVNRSTITNCSNSGEIRVNRYGAGIAGSSSSTTITGCFNNGTIFCPGSGAAGIVANLGSGTVTNCYNSGYIGSTGNLVGGIVATGSNVTVTDCINIGIVDCKQTHGSVMGEVSKANATISNLYYLEGTCEKGIGKVANAETQTAAAKTAAELKKMIADGDHPYKEQMLADLAVRAQEIADKAAAKNVDDLIDAIGDVVLTDDCKAAIDAARKAYEALTDVQKELVSKLDTLTDAEAAYEALANQAAAKAVDDLIDAIGDVVLTDDCKAAIDAARKAYEALTDVQKALVEKLDTLTAAEAAYKKLADDKAAVDDVIAKIDAIGKVKITNTVKAAIDAARAAYDALPDELKAQVTNYDTLTAAEKRYQQLLDKRKGNDSSSSDSNDGKTDSKTDGKNVKSGNTADNSHLTLWMGGVVVSAAALLLLAKKRRQDA